ncbi:MAG TPA: hypothetical protein VLV45_13280 [Gemmatimonadales bacterium]|nr:hypothetical protein [Gemmatimonadales bacterium]
MHSFRSLVITVAALLALVARSAVAGQTTAPKPLAITAHNVTAEAAHRDAKELARPGDEIRYSLVFTNTGQNSVKNVQFTDPIPQGTVYVLGSAAAPQSTRIDYSIDGGKTWSEQPMIVAVENGKTVQKPAPRENYTHVRWTVLESVAPGAQVTAEFRAQVGTTPGEAK